VEYGDFECPYCGRAEPALRALERDHDREIAFVFRHLPLDDVHPHARLAAEASEAAGAQGRFWEMHDVLMDHQEALEEADIWRYAHALGLDMERFTSEVRGRRYAARVDRDVRSADESGAAGTPTFFLNGRRYEGTDGEREMLAAVERLIRAT
jgi:protein-disulfide isomerase